MENSIQNQFYDDSVEKQLIIEGVVIEEMG